MFKKIYSLFIWTILFALIPGLLIIGNLSCFSQNPRKIYHWGTRVWAKTLLWLMRIKVITENYQNIQKNINYIFASNHQSSLDILVLAAAIPRRFLFVMDEELFKIPLLGKYCRKAQYLSISRRYPVKAAKDIQNIIHQLKHGESIVFFPEGGRSREGKLGEFKSGIGQVAAGSGRAVVPVAVSGSARLLPRGSFVFYPGEVRLKFGKPVHFGPVQSHQEIAKKVRSDVAEMLET